VAAAAAALGTSDLLLSMKINANVCSESENLLSFATGGSGGGVDSFASQCNTRCTNIGRVDPPTDRAPPAAPCLCAFNWSGSNARTVTSLLFCQRHEALFSHLRKNKLWLNS
jgi:hypothetical protein